MVRNDKLYHLAYTGLPQRQGKCEGKQKKKGEIVSTPEYSVSPVLGEGSRGGRL